MTVTEEAATGPSLTVSKAVICGAWGGEGVGGGLGGGGGCTFSVLGRK